MTTEVKSDKFADLFSALKIKLVGASRTLGAKVCEKREHKFFYPDGMYVSWQAYSCVRCGALDRPLETLPYAPSFDDEEYYSPADDFLRHDEEHQEAVHQAMLVECRWVSWLPYPRWL